MSRRSGRQHLRHAGAQRKPWYGLQDAWLEPLEADARSVHGDDLRVSTSPGRRMYRVPVEVPGRRQRVEITIAFYERPPYDCYGLSPQEYPRVFSCTLGPSPHRMPDGSLCLYYPRSAPERRWRPENGLLALIDLARDHVFFEDYWRDTRDEDGAGEWLGAEQPHGFPEQVSA
jgi:hypothetical protein